MDVRSVLWGADTVKGEYNKVSSLKKLSTQFKLGKAKFLFKNPSIQIHIFYSRIRIEVSFPTIRILISFKDPDSHVTGCKVHLYTVKYDEHCPDRNRI